MEKNTNNLSNNEKTFIVPCPCGKTEHYSYAKYCANCGKKLEGTAVTAPSK